MSERLTTRLANGGVGYDNGEYFKVCYPWNEHCLTDIDRMAILLCDLEDKIEQGKIVELPCKVGQWVYVPWHWEGQQAVAMVKVEEIKLYDSQMHYMFFIDMESDDESFNQAFGGWKTGDSIGKTVFIDRAEAEAKVREMEGDNNE